MPCEPKKYSRPKTTTAVCQIPSIWRPKSDENKITISHNELKNDPFLISYTFMPKLDLFEK